MLDNYLIVDKKVLPEVYGKVLEVKRMMEEGIYTQVSDAVKAVGISRSAYYKYKDHIFMASTQSRERRAVFSFLLSHQKGLLSEVLNRFSSFHCSVLTLSQSIPVHNAASVSLSIDISEMNISVEELMKEIEKMNGVSKLTLQSLE